MKAKLESITTDRDSSFRILLTPNLNEIFYWHFHPEYEIVYVETKSGFRHIGDHISKYEGSDLALIGPNIPHLNFDYGVKATVDTVVIQMKENFLGKDFFSLPEITAIKMLFEKAKSGVVFYGKTKKLAGEKLKQITSLPHFEQLITLLQVFNLLAKSNEIEILKARPIASASLLKEQQRLQKVYHFIEANYQSEIDVNAVAKLCNLTTAAFCRYFKKSTHYTFTDFLNQFRINQSKKILLQDKNVTEACYESGFANISYFNKTFKKVTGENPSAFKRRHLAE
ncbi:AraC family transcriptional regulator [Niastella vici]|uniref:AraC family transcriptional regulator n=1 Tax=Niastella vici TaxID=1703345 RepID=A0A1V9FR23_9BACT|nr:AraC family transcriptional regulator [Niastella vici]OQP60731.1 AraC family transcriptional regulator [Niastella vici]